jgi:hypothetical protein
MLDRWRSAEMKLLSRVLLALAALALVGGLVLGAIPIRVHPANAPVTAGHEKVSCGTPFSETKWSSDDACEGLLLNQTGVVFMAFALCVVSFVLGAGVLVLSMSRQLRYSGA